MKITNNQLRECGLGRKLVENGFGDVKVRINNDEIHSVKSILMTGNNVLRKLLEDEKLGNELVLFEECNKMGFFELEKYYSGGEIELTKSNVCDVLMFCICYNEEVIEKKCEEFIKENVDDNLLVSLIHIMNVFPYVLSELTEFKISEFEKRGYKYMYNDKWLLQLEQNNLEDILSFSNLVIRNETWLLSRLLKWYSYRINEKNYDSEMSNSFQCLINNHFHNDKVKIDDLNDDFQRVYKSLDIDLHNNESIKYIDLYNVEDENIQNVVMKYYYDENEVIIKEEDISLISELNEEKMNNLINSLLDIEDYKMKEIGIYIMNNFDKCNNFNKIRNELLLKLCEKYKAKPDCEVMRLIGKSLHNIENMNTIKTAYGLPMLWEIHNKCSLNYVTVNILNQYIDDEEKMRRLEYYGKEYINKELESKDCSSKTLKIKKSIVKKYYKPKQYPFFQSSSILEKQQKDKSQEE